MRGGKGPGRGKPDRQAHARLQVTLLRNLKRYSQEVVAWSQIIEISLRRSKHILAQLRCEHQAEWMERFFPQKEAEIEKCELVEYYRYYQISPLLVDSYHFQFMNHYWSRSKTLYYLRIKRVLQIEDDYHQQSIERNIEQTGSEQTEEDKRTFYLFRELSAPPALPQDNNSTLQKILSTLQTKHSTVKRRNYRNMPVNPSTSKPSRTKERVSQLKSSKPSNNHIVSTFSCKPPPRRKNNYKSLSSQTLHSQERVSKSKKKLATTNSCLNIVQHQSNLNYQRREKANKIQPKKKQTPQTHHKVKSSEKSEVRGSKSGKKRKQTSSNVKAAIDKTKLKIKMQKNMVIKKHLQSRQSYAKSIDSTCGQAIRPMRR